MTATRPALYTIGHSTRSVDAFVELLREHGVRLLVDVRRFPGSRRHPHFGRDALAAHLAARGIAYAHEPELGGRRDPRPDSVHVGLRNAAFRAYADHMHGPGFREALGRVLESACEGPVAVMCAEAVPWRCHRWLLADAATAAGVHVVHILGPGATKGHVLSPHAVVGPEGLLHYAGAPEQRTLFDDGRADA